MAEEETPKKQTRAPGERSRARVVEQAARLATIEGIEGISIGRLADATGIAKSSVYALFGSKEELQLATINAARDSFIIEVVTPALRRPSPVASACSPFARASSPTSSGASSRVAASSSPPPPRLAVAPDASMTRSLASNSSGATCSGAKPAPPLIEANCPLAPIPSSSPLNSV